MYTLIVFIILIYVLSISKATLDYTQFKKQTQFEYLNGLDVWYILITPIFLILLTNFVWSGPVLTCWFGNLVLTSFQLKIAYLIILLFILILYSYCSSFYFSSKDVYDFIMVCYNFFFWIYFLFFANTLFTFIFFIEILSTLVFLMLITTTFTTTYFYNNLNLNLYNYFTTSMPFLLIQMLMFFFWTSLISSLNLFFFLILFYLKFFSFDWFLIEFIFYYIIIIAQNYDYFTLSLVWFNFLFCFFLKCGLVPFFLWKPTFFKGMTLYSISFYILFFYFFIFLFFIYFFLNYINEIFFFFIGLNVLIIFFGILILLCILCEAFYIKTFLALSSILNTLFIFLAMNNFNPLLCAFII